MPKETYVLKLIRPNEVGLSEMREYLTDAIRCWGGQNHPEHPMFYPFRKPGSLKLKRIPRKGKKK